LIGVQAAWSGDLEIVKPAGERVGESDPLERPGTKPVVNEFCRDSVLGPVTHNSSTLTLGRRWTDPRTKLGAIGHNLGTS